MENGKTDLKDGKILEDAVHHVLLGQVFELVDKIDHVLAHGRPMDAINEAAILETSVFRFHFFHHLLTKRAHFGWARDGHVFITLVPVRLILEIE